jgi:ribonuclease BN (tRNA processing enzyme)
VGALTLIHLDPRLADHDALLQDAAAGFERVALGEDLMVVAGDP